MAAPLNEVEEVITLTLFLFIYLYMFSQLEKEIQKNIKEIPDLKLKYRAIALNSVLNQKKKLDEELEKEIRALNQKYEKLALPLYEKVSFYLNFLQSIYFFL